MPLGYVDDSDIIKFTADDIRCENKRFKCEYYFDGSDVGLDDNAEDLEWYYGNRQWGYYCLNES